MDNSNGFTIHELLIGLGILAMLTAVAIPNYISWLPSYHLQSTASDMEATIRLAKMTAIRENLDVVVNFNPVDDNYQVFIDSDADGIRDTNERIIRSRDMSPGIDLTGTDFGSNKLTFNGRGLANSSGDITIKNKLNEELTVNVTITGSSRINI